MYYRELENELIRLSQYFKVLTVTGPRQSGKKKVIYTGNSESQSPENGYINYLNISTL